MNHFWIMVAGMLSTLVCGFSLGVLAERASTAARRKYLEGVLAEATQAEVVLNELMNQTGKLASVSQTAVYARMRIYRLDTPPLRALTVSDAAESVRALARTVLNISNTHPDERLRDLGNTQHNLAQKLAKELEGFGS